MSLQVWLPLNGDLHNQGLSNVVISNNGASINTSGKIGSCYSFNGSNSYIRSNSTCLSNNDTEWSYTCWFYPTNAHNGCLFSNRTSADSKGITIFYYTSKFLIDDGVRWEFTPSTAISVGAWNHLAIVRKAGSYKKFYLNGQLINSTTTTGTPTLANSSWFSIGTSQNSATTATTNPLNGRLNDVRIYNHALSDKEVEEVSKGLILHYPLNKINVNTVENLRYSGEKVSFVANNTVLLQNIIADIVPAQTKYGTASPTNIRVISGRTNITIYQNVYNYVEQDLLLQASGWERSTDTDFTTYKGVPVYKGTIVNLYNKFGNGKYLPIYGTEVGKQYIIGCWWRSVNATTSNGIKINVLYSDGSTTAVTPATQNANQVWKLRSVLSVASKKIIGLTFSYNSSYPIYMAGLMCMEKSLFDSLNGNEVVFNNDIRKYVLPLNTTIYGGSDNISAGVLTKTHEYLTLPTTGWAYANGIFYLEDALPARNNGYYDSTKWTCNQYAVAAAQSSTTNAANSFADLSIGVQSGNYPRRILVKDTRYNDAASFMEGMTTPISIVYDKEIVETITLPSQQISTMIGLNNLFTDNKNIELTYGDSGFKMVYDVSGYENNGIIIGNANTIEDTKRYTMATSMNNTSSENRIESNANIVIPSDAISVSFWVKTTSKATNQVIFALSNLIEFGTLNSLGYVNPPASQAGFTLNNFINNAWNHIVVIRINNTFKLYINCIEETRNGANNYYIHNNSKLYLLNRSYNNNYAANAAISDFRIYTTVLSEEQILELYHTSATIDKNGNVYAREYIENDNLNITRTGIFGVSNVYDDNDLTIASVLKTSQQIQGNTIYEY